MKNEVCGTCRFWDNTEAASRHYDERYDEEHEALGTCTYAIHPIDDNSIKLLTACVIDGSGYFAALKTRDTHGCIAWIIKDNLCKVGKIIT